MNHRTFTSLMLQYRSRLDGTVHELIEQYEYQAAGETLSPENIGKSYGMGLDAVQAQLPGGLRNFEGAAEHLVSHINQWIGSAQHAHYEYIRAMKNPDFRLKAGDVVRAVKYASDPSAAKFLFDLVVEVGKSFFSSQGDIKRAAAYLSAVNEFDDQVQFFIYGSLWDALAADLP